MAFRHLLSGFDTIEAAYYLTRQSDGGLDFRELEVEKSSLKYSKSKHPKALRLGSEEFLLANHGTGSGFPFLLENDSFSIQCGEYNKPNFFVTYRSHALWHQGAMGLHQRFLTWAESVGLRPYRSESLSRVDFTFDYWIDAIDFDEDNGPMSLRRAPCEPPGAPQCVCRGVGSGSSRSSFLGPLSRLWRGPCHRS